MTAKPIIAKVTITRGTTSNPIGRQARGDDAGRFRVVIVAVKPTSDSGGANGLRGCQWRTGESKNESESGYGSAHGSLPITVSCSILLLHENGGAI
jgi:hypothetical protein